MKQIVVTAFGDSSQLQLVDAPEPTGEVIVQVRAAGLNYADLMQREGMYLGGPKPPYVPGVEAAGVVVGGALPAGTRVMVVTGGGCYAERVAVRAHQCVPLPAELDFVHGAAFPVTFLTAYHALVTVARAAPGEHVLVHAAGGGVGTAAVQIAKLLGLRVIATASTEDKRARVRALGADVVVDYADFEAATRAEGGAAIVLESIGGDVFRKSLAVLQPLGRVVLYGIATKQGVPIDPLKLLFGSRAVMGFHLDAIVARRDLLASSLQLLVDHVRAGRLAITVGHTFPLAEARAAHDLVANRASFGKVVLVP
jgi:NADPH2:quinone reductase